MAVVHYVIGIPIYNIDVDLYLANKPGDINELYAKRWPGLKCAAGPNTRAHALHVNGNTGNHFCMFLVDDLCNEGSVVHEALHLSYYILDFVGVKFDGNNHEAQAYLLQYIYDKVMGIAKNKKFKFK